MAVKFESKFPITDRLSAAQPHAPLHLVEFSNASVKLGKEKYVQFQSFISPQLNSLTRSKRIILAHTKGLQYTGSNFESEMDKITSSVLKVGVLNKHTKTIKLYDADFFHLKPILKYHLEKKETEKNWQEQSKDLTLEFGSKRKKLNISKMNILSTENVSIASMIPSELSEAKLEQANTVETKGELDIIPTQNKNAKSVDDVYNIRDIITEEELSSLDSIASIFTNISRESIQLWKSEKRFCTFIVHYLEIKYQNISLHNAKLLCYLNYMMCLYKCNYKDLRKKDPIPEVPQPYKKNLMNKYTLNSRMPQRMKDKLLAHAMVLALSANNYHIDGKIWESSTQINIKRLVLMAYALGCHVYDRKNEGTKLIELKLPLYKYEPRGKKWK